MSRSLIHRYIYGHEAPPHFSPQGDLYWGIPERQRDLMHLAAVQIETQQAAAERISVSQSEAAQCIVRELRQRTEQIEEATRAGAETVASAVDQLVDRLSYELGEIRWELSQLRSGTEQVLAVLRRPRSTEAQELIKQGVRNLINGKLEEAEDRFVLAWKLDNTDFQVLLNLAAVALRRGDAAQSLSYLKDALTLPDSLDATSRAEALWMTGRVHYASESYEDAWRISGQSLAFGSTARRVLEMGVYGLMSGHEEEGLGSIRQAVRQEAALMALAASAPDLRAFGSRVEPLLDMLVAEVTEAIREMSARLTEEAQRLRSTKPQAAELLAGAVALSLKAIDGTYTERRKAADALSALEPAPMAIEEWRRAETAREGAERRTARAQRDLEVAQRVVKLDKFRKAGYFATGGFCLAWIASFALASVLEWAMGERFLEAWRGRLSVVMLSMWIGVPIWLGAWQSRRIESNERRERTARQHLGLAQTATEQERTREARAVAHVNSLLG